MLNSIYATRFIAKSEIAKWPVIGWLSARTGTLFVKRGNITADIYFTPLIHSENTTRKQISQQSYQQMQGVLNKKL